jgi:hypothetical protein
VSWLQRLFGKLKSVFGDKGAQEKAATEAATPPRAKVSAEPAEKAPEPAAVLTEDKPADEPEDTAKEADEPAPEETSVAEAKPATEEPAPAEEPTADSAEPAADAAPEPTAAPAAAAESAVSAEPAAAAEPAVSAEPVAAAGPAAPAEPVAFAEPVTEAEPVEPAAAPADEPVTSAATEEPVEPAPKPVERVNPAINTLDDDSRTAELIAEGPYGPGSGKPTADGSAPSVDFTVKAKQSSKLFHTEKSPYFSRTKADVWFKTEADAEAAGFQAWDHKKRAGAKK